MSIYSVESVHTHEMKHPYTDLAVILYLPVPCLNLVTKNFRSLTDKTSILVMKTTNKSGAICHQDGQETVHLPTTTTTKGVGGIVSFVISAL